MPEQSLPRRRKWSPRQRGGQHLSRTQSLRHQVALVDAHDGALRRPHLRMEEYPVLKNLNKPINQNKETDTIMMQYLKKILMEKVTAKIGHHGTTDGRLNNGMSG